MNRSNALYIWCVVGFPQGKRTLRRPFAQGKTERVVVKGCEPGGSVILIRPFRGVDDAEYHPLRAIDHYCALT